MIAQCPYPAHKKELKVEDECAKMGYVRSFRLTKFFE